MENPSLVPLSLTHVHYDPNDPISHLSAFLALVPQGLFLTYVILSLTTREIEVLLMFAGQMACEALNWVLKRTIRENRPTLMHGKGYGMPSSHAQFMAFFSTYLTLFLLFRHASSQHPAPSNTHSATPFYQRLLLSFLSIAIALAVAQSRIYLGYHSPKQVYVGYTVGFTCAIVYFAMTGLARKSGWIDWVLELGIVRLFKIRDLVLYEDPADASWSRWEDIRQKRDTIKKK